VVVVHTSVLVHPGTCTTVVLQYMYSPSKRHQLATERRAVG